MQRLLRIQGCQLSMDGLQADAVQWDDQDQLQATHTHHASVPGTGALNGLSKHKREQLPAGGA